MREGIAGGWGGRVPQGVSAWEEGSYMPISEGASPMRTGLLSADTLCKRLSPWDMKSRGWGQFPIETVAFMGSFIEDTLTRLPK